MLRRPRLQGGRALIALAIIIVIIILVLFPRPHLPTPAAVAASTCLDKITQQHARLTKLNAKARAFIEITPLELALARARELDQAPARGALHCMTVAVKDNIETSTKIWGLQTSAGSQALLDLLKSNAKEVLLQSAPAIALLEREGVVIMGKANMDDFALSYHTYSTRLGQTPNALDVTRYPGGSSGGSAIACALNMVDFAIGTDTGGSIRIPSAFNGIVGLRPAQGAISTRGVVPLSNSRDTVGPMARDVSTVRMVFQVLAERQCAALPLPPHASLRVGALADYFDAGGGSKLLDKLARILPGISIEMVQDYPAEFSLSQLKLQTKSASMYEFKSNLEQYLKTRSESAAAPSLEDIVRKTREICDAGKRGADATACGFVVDSLEKKLATGTRKGAIPASLQAKWETMAQELREFMTARGFHALLIPAVSVQPTKFASGRRQEFCPNNRLASITGLASLVVPTGLKFSAFELIGMDECVLFQLAQARD